MQKYKKPILLITFAFVWITTTGSLYFFGKTDKQFEDFVPTKCTVLKNYFESTSDKNKCHYNGLVDVSYLTNNGTLIGTIVVYHDTDDISQLQQNLQNNYPITSCFTCYYNLIEPTIVRLDVNNSNQIVMFFCVIVFLGGALILFWLFVWIIKDLTCLSNNSDKITDDRQNVYIPIDMSRY